MSSRRERILHGPIGPTLAQMTLPMVLGIAAMFLFQAVDTWFIGRLGTEQLAAISFTFPVTFAVINLTVGLSIATSILLATAIGGDRLSLAQRIATDSLLLTVILTVALGVAGWLTLDPLFRLLGAGDSTLPYIRDYMTVWYAAVGLMVVPMVVNGALRATGDTRWPSLIMVLSGLVNAALDPLLIFGWGPVPAMGIRGAAIASAIAWAVGFVLAFWLIRVRERLLVFHPQPLRELLGFWRDLLRTGIPISLANMLTPVGNGILTALVARHGEEAVAAFGAGSRIEALSMVVCFALTSALSPYMAQNLGYKQLDRAWQSLHLGLRFALIYQLLLYALLATLSPWLKAVFSPDPSVQALTQLYLWIMPLGFVGYALVIVMNTAFNAGGQSDKTLWLSALRVFVCIAPCAWIGSELGGLTGLFIGTVAGNAVALLPGKIMLSRCYRKLAG
ncbi:MAG: MATE family efflux transporter [Pseudomonadota bacterium]